MNDNKDLIGYLVQADDRGDEVSLRVGDRKEALATAVGWASQGRTDIKIFGDGRIFTAKELARRIIEEE